jgi:hypothetical protein
MVENEVAETSSSQPLAKSYMDKMTGDSGPMSLPLPNSMPEVRTHAKSTHKKLFAKPFKRAFTKKFNHEQVSAWEKNIDNSRLQKISAYSITDPQKGDVYIFECDLPIKDAKECDDYLWIADGGGEKHKTIKDVKRIYFRAMNMDGKKTNITKIAYHFFERKPQVLMFLYRDGTRGCLPIGTILNKHKKPRGTKCKIPPDSDESEREENIDDPAMIDYRVAEKEVDVDGRPDEDVDPSTIPDEVFAGGLFKLPAKPANFYINTQIQWRTNDIKAAFKFAEDHKLFQVIINLAYAKKVDKIFCCCTKRKKYIMQIVRKNYLPSKLHKFFGWELLLRGSCYLAEMSP